MDRRPAGGKDFLHIGLVLVCLFVVTSACGYRVAGSVQSLPGGIRSLGIPTFRNLTREYKLEQRISAAVLKEFSLRTRIPVKASAAAVDAVIVGEIRDLSASPITFGTDAFGSTFQVSVLMSVRLVRASDGAVLWENPDFAYRASYVLNNKVTQFFSEENVAVDRLAREFAASLASAILAR